MNMPDSEDENTQPGIEKGTHECKAKKQNDLKPCERCRSQHLKCVYAGQDTKCERCDRSGHACVRSTKKIRFRDVPVSRFRGDRKAGRTVAGRTKTKTVLNENSIQNGTEPTIEPAAPVVTAAQSSEASITSDSTVLENHDQHNGKTFKQYESIDIITTEPMIEHGLTPQFDNADAHQQLESEVFCPPARPVPTPSEDRFSISGYNEQAPLTRILSSDRGSNLSFSGSPYSRTRRSSISKYLVGLVRPQSRNITQTVHDFTESILLRYFRTELAPWFDLCDPDHHFANVIPQKAREPGPLRSAILTIAARNLARSKRFRNTMGVVEWEGRLLPNLTEDFAVPYHNECIRDLLQLSMDPRKLHDETLLAAVLALRTDEEMGLQAGGEEEEDQQLFLRIASVFIDAQLPPALALPHSSPEVFSSTLADEANHSNMASPSVHTEDLGASGLRQACFWTAFRQDLHAAFLKQQPVRFPLSRCEVFRQVTPATDAFWANRMVTFCADVLEFSYGSDSSDGKVMPSYTNHERWHELRDREQLICSLLPTSFEPTFCSEPDLLHGVFPEILYLDPCHVSGTTYIELARMLLEVFNPTRPKLGHGFLAATNAFITSTKKILFRLCGIALSNHHHCPPCLINACLGISMFGEYFDDPIEQDALLGVLALMHNQYAYPTNQIAKSLRRAWNNEELEKMSSAAFFDRMDTE